MDPLTRTVLATICYYDALEYALSAFDVWRHLSLEDVNVQPQYRNARTVGEVLIILDTLVRDGRIICANGLYTLPGSTSLIQERQRRNRISTEKLQKMSRAVRLLRYMPFVRMVWVTGRLAMKNAVDTSDWDVLIILKKNHIWTGRFAITILTQIMGLRRTDAHHADHLCLNYWITTESMMISLDDRYSAHEYMTARPLFASINPEAFLHANSWIKKFRPNFDTTILSSPYRVHDTQWTHVVRRSIESILQSISLEHFLKKMQRSKIMHNPKTFQKGSMIIANDDELVFLPSPHSPRVLTAYHQRCQQEGLRACA